MARPMLSDFLRRLTRGMAAETLAECSDRELVHRAIDQHDEASLQAIINRHGAMVYRVCWRILQHSQDTEDAFQATFLILAQKLRTVRKQASLASWLHGVARRIALKARAQSDARRRREQIASSTASRLADDLTWGDLRAALDDELSRLPSNWREPLILCYLEGHTQDEAAALLECSKSTLRRRLDEARTALGNRLSARGLVLPGVLSAVLLSECQASASLTPNLIASLVNQANAALVGRSLTAASPRVLALMKGVRTTMFLTNFKPTVALALCVGLAAAAGSGASLIRPESPAASAENPPPNLNQPEQIAAPKHAAGIEKAAKESKEAPKALRVVVLDPAGKPLEGAKVHSSIWTHEPNFKANHDYLTDAEGVAKIELPKSYYILRIWASKKTYVSMFSHWEQADLASGVKVPAEYKIWLETPTSIGGRILDEQDTPIVGAKVQVAVEKSSGPVKGDGRIGYDTWVAEGNDAVLSDANGRWHLDNVPNQRDTEFRLLVIHDDFISDTAWRGLQKLAGTTSAQLFDKTSVIRMKKGVRVAGQVTDPQGKPIKGAIVVRGNDPYFSSTVDEFLTDADGKFLLPAMQPAEMAVTVVAPGFAPQLRHVTLKDGLPAQDFQMQPGKPIRLKFVDASGKPMTRVGVRIDGWKGSKSLQNVDHPKVRKTGIPYRPDKNGVWEWTWAPTDPVKLEVSAIGGAPVELEIGGGAPPRTIVLKPEHRIVGRVTDAATGKEIPEFTIVPLNVFRKDWISAERGNGMQSKQGRFEFLAERTDHPLRLRIEAPGYRSKTGPEFRVGDDSNRKQDFQLEPSPPVAGTVVDFTGRPVAGAMLSIATPTEIIELDSDWNNHKASTDPSGRFSFPNPDEPVTLIAEADAGFAMGDFVKGRREIGTMKLRPWAAIRGQFLDGGKPVAGASVMVDFIRIHSPELPMIQTSKLQVTTDAEGRFAFTRLPPIPVALRVYLGPWRDHGFRSGPAVPLDLQPGQKLEVNLGSGGAMVSGKVQLTGKVPADLDCNFSLNYLVQRGPGITPPPEIARLGFDASKGWSDTWTKSAEGQAFFGTLRHWFVKLAPDGSYRISGVPPGQYDLSVKIYAKPSGCLIDPVARAVVPVTVTARDVEKGQLTLLDIHAPVVPVPTIGDAPGLKFQGVDDTSETLTGSKGKLTLVHFWASWCGPCKQQLPAVRELQKHYASRGLAALSLSLDEDKTLWMEAMKRHDLAWPQGRVSATNAAGISSVPAYWLLDGEGKLVAKPNDTDELAKELAERFK
jgi:RNA polymerase sigma factor (sigma-70 family)